MSKKNPLTYNLLVAFTFFISLNVQGQNFVKVNDSDNPIVTQSGIGNYTGVSWVDYDNDDDLDLFVGNTKLFKNNGDGTFSSINSNIGSGTFFAIGNGNTWGDYDNDGDLDVFISSSASYLYRNDGDDVFTKIENGDIGLGDGNRGWSSAWVDMNNDGYLDLSITHPSGFVFPFNDPTSNHILMNDGPPNFSFTKKNETPASSEFFSFTVGSWSDYDQDGDMDYFIGSGPASTTSAVDRLYKNLFIETGSFKLERLSQPPLTTTKLDGQVWNWVDIDNDLDLDAYVTNWGGNQGGGLENVLFENVGEGSFVKISDSSESIVSDRQVSLSSVWGDFDNDGDLDVFVTNDEGTQDKFYKNNGDGTFICNPISESSKTHRGATAGDYDNDGDLDLFVAGPASSELFRNDLENENSWIKLKLNGKVSNKSAIGAKIKLKATIDENKVWQIREISAQNTFNGQHSLIVHFGLGNATSIDSVIIDWPGSGRQVLEALEVNQLFKIEEDINTVSIENEEGSNTPRDFRLNQNYPNPFNPSTTLSYELNRSSYVNLSLYNLIGQSVMILDKGLRTSGKYTIELNAKILPSGTYFYRLETDYGFSIKKLTLIK